MDAKLRNEIAQLHAQICQGLADPNRILILYALRDNDCNVSDLAKMIGLPHSTISRHLKTLRERRMVSTRREGQMIYYTLADERIVRALDLLRAMMADSLEGQASLARTFQQDLR